MSSQYNGGHWNQNQMNFAPLHLEEEYQFNPISVSGNDSHQQLLDGQPSYGSEAYQYSQQQLPPNPNNSTLHSPYAPPANTQQHHPRTVPSQHLQGNINPGYGHNVYAQQQRVLPAAEGGIPYRTNPAAFNLPAPVQGIEASRIQQATLTPSTFTQALPHEGFPRASTSTHQHEEYYERPPEAPSSGKRPRFQFNEQDDQEGDLTQEQKDANKSKLSRACARCKNLKVRCEAKTETEPCKRCFNGGHECVIPGRKIRRTPPKREYLLSQIQSQAAEIERLMQELEKVSAASASASPQVKSMAQLMSPVLSPSTTPPHAYFAELHAAGIDDTSYSHGGGANGNNALLNKAVEDWIAKARESLHEFGTFIGIGGAGMPKSYLVEDSDSDDDEFVDVQEELDEGQIGSPDDRYGLAVQDPSGEGTTIREGTAPPKHLRHHSSNSSIGTVGTEMTGVTTGTSGTAGTNTHPRPKKLGNENFARPANLPVEASPFGLFGKLSLKAGPKSRASSTEPEDHDGSGIANDNFFKSTPAPNALGRRLESAQHQAPTILTRGIISPVEAEKLFKIFFDNMNLSVSLLDPVLYTAQRTFYRSPFLFTVICAIASRFYAERSDLYAKTMHHAQLAAGNALISGNKNVEMCQAYILLSLYPVPARKWEDQRSWLYLGLAIRTATDLNLHLPTTAKPLNENHAREMLNRTRVWLNCLNLDRSTGSQYGKPPIISSADYIANHSQNWWESSQYNMTNFDIHICAYNAELKVMSAFIAKINSNPDHPTGLNKNVDFERIATETDDELKTLMDHWFSKIAKTDLNDPQNCFRTGLLRLAYSYSRLVALSYGFQHAFGKVDDVDENPFLMRCLKAASDVVDAVVHDICRPTQLHFFRHGPEAQSVFVTFASAFLVKLLQPRFASYLTQDTRVEIRTLVQKVIDLLGSPEVAIDDRHGPKLYSRFLEKLMARPMARLDPLSPASTNTAALPRQRRAPRTSATNTPEPASNAFETLVYNHPSPSTSNSLSPPPTESALSFESFAPNGPTDPFALETAATLAANNVDGPGVDSLMTGNFFSPPLPFDNAIVQSMQSLTDPSGWQDISLPGFDWMAQFQRNLGLDINEMYEQNMDYLTGPPNGS